MYAVQRRAHRSARILSLTLEASADIRYLGTGDAFDEQRPNTSLVVTYTASEGPLAGWGPRRFQHTGPYRLLVDCGYAIPHALWRVSTDPNYLDGIYITHAHADHVFGLPAVIARLGEDGRTRPLILAGGPSSRAAIERVLELGYPGMIQKTPFPLDFREIEAPTGLGPWTARTARSLHTQPDDALRLDAGGLSVAISGDGAPSAATRALFAGVRLLVHEAYYTDRNPKTGHASVPDLIELAESAGIGALHLVHRRRGTPAPDPGPRGHWPNPGDVYQVGP